MVKQSNVQPCAHQISPFLPHFWPKNGHILTMMAIFAHRHLQRLQMGWTLVEQGWTLSNTSRVTCLDPQGPQKVAPGGPRGPQNGHILPMIAIFAHRHLQRLQMGWTLFGQGWTLSNTYRVTCLGLKRPFLPKIPIGTIGTSNSSKWVGHWLDKAGHCLTHPR